MESDGKLEQPSYIVFIESRRTRRNLKHTTESPHVSMRLHFCTSALSLHVESMNISKKENMERIQGYPFVSRQYWSFTRKGLNSWAITTSVFSTYLKNFSKTFQLLR